MLVTYACHIPSNRDYKPEGHAVPPTCQLPGRESTSKEAPNSPRRVYIHPIHTNIGQINQLPPATEYAGVPLPSTPVSFKIQPDERHKPANSVRQAHTARLGGIYRLQWYLAAARSQSTHL